jgi:hypothetical protein
VDQVFLCFQFFLAGSTPEVFLNPTPVLKDEREALFNYLKALLYAA